MPTNTDKAGVPLFAVRELVKISGREKSLGVPEKVWQLALSKTLLDPVANIKHAALHGDSAWRVHVAQIPEKVTCHVHCSGNEVYEVVEGQGTLFYGAVTKHDNVYLVAWEPPISVCFGDNFIIPQGFAHQLVRVGDKPLVILFACPDEHLGKDRVVLAGRC